MSIANWNEICKKKKQARELNGLDSHFKLKHVIYG